MKAPGDQKERILHARGLLLLVWLSQGRGKGRQQSQQVEGRHISISRTKLYLKAERESLKNWPEWNAKFEHGVSSRTRSNWRKGRERLTGPQTQARRRVSLDEKTLKCCFVVLFVSGSGIRESG